MDFSPAERLYKSASQHARIWTEEWVHDQSYCPNCGSQKVSKFENNRPVADFYCAACAEEFELKSQKSKFGSKIVDGAYRTMCERLASDNNPNFMLLNYDSNKCAVIDFLIVPKHFFVPEIIERRAPLASTARRAGWVGCNILLNKIPRAGMVYLVRNREPLPKSAVMQRWKETLFLRQSRTEARGWLLDVMKCVDSIGRSEFTLEAVYRHGEPLYAKYPNNRHVKEKIRQQLQILRNKGYLHFLSRGHYSIASMSEGSNHILQR